MSIIEELYDMSECPDGFISNFSLTKLTEETHKKFANYDEEICFLISPSPSLDHKITNWETFQEQNASTFLNNILFFLKEIQYHLREHQTTNSSSLIYLFTFTNKVEQIDLDRNGPNEIEEILKSKMHTTEVIDPKLAISDLINKMNEINVTKKNKGRFLRIIMFTGEIEKSLSSEDLENVLSSFTPDKTGYCGITCNLLFTEYDPDFIQNTRNEETYQTISDTPKEYFDNNLRNESKEISFLNKIYKTKLLHLENTNANIHDQYEDATKETDYIMNYIKQFDEHYKLIQRGYDAILKEYRNFKKARNQKDKQIIQSKINNDVVNNDFVKFISNPILNFIENESQTMNSQIEKHKNQIRESGEEIRKVENEIRNLNLNHHVYWKKKLEFLNEQLNVFDKYLQQVEKLKEYIDYITSKMNDYINNITS